MDSRELATIFTDPKCSVTEKDFKILQDNAVSKLERNDSNILFPDLYRTVLKMNGIVPIIDQPAFKSRNITFQYSFLNGISDIPFTTVILNWKLNQFRFRRRYQHEELFIIRSSFVNISLSRLKLNGLQAPFVRSREIEIFHSSTVHDSCSVIERSMGDLNKDIRINLGEDCAER